MATKQDKGSLLLAICNRCDKEDVGFTAKDFDEYYVTHGVSRRPSHEAALSAPPKTR